MRGLVPLLNRQGYLGMSTWKLEVGRYLQQCIDGERRGLTEVRSGTKPKWLANGTTYILIAIEYDT